MTAVFRRTLLPASSKKFLLMAMIPLLAATVALIGAPPPALLADSGDDTATASAPPSGLTANYADGRLTLSWTKGTDSTYLEQFVEWRVSGVTPISWQGGVVFASMENLVFPNRLLQPDTTYIFRVSGAKPVDELMTAVASSNEATVSIPDEFNTAPYAPAQQAGSESASTPAPASRSAKTGPSGLSVAQAGGGVALNWTPGTNPNYVRQIVRRRVAEITPIAWTDVVIGVLDSAYTDNSAEPGYPYIYRVRAEKANGKGGETDASRIIGPGAPDNRVASSLHIEGGGPFSQLPAGLRLLTWNPPKHPRYTSQVVVYRESYFDRDLVLHERTVRSMPRRAGIAFALFSPSPSRTYTYWVETQRQDDARIKKFSSSVSQYVPAIAIPPPTN